MAQLVVSAVGAGVGFMIGGPAGAQIGWVAGSMVGAYALAENQTHEGPRLKDLKITGTDYGDTIPWVAGSPRIAGQIIWASKRRERRHEESVGGKGGGGATQVTYTYDCDLLILLTENTSAGVARIWSNNELILNGSTAKDGVWTDLRIYDGDLGQLPDPVYEAAVGVGNAPAYRGRTTLMIQGLQLGGSGVIPNLTFEISPASTKVVELWKYSSTQLVPSINNKSQRFLMQGGVGVGSNFGHSYIREEDAFFGPRYVEFYISQEDAARGWYFGGVSRNSYSTGDYPRNPNSNGNGVWCVTNGNFNGQIPASYANGYLTAEYGAIDALWFGRVGVMIDNSAEVLQVFLNGALIKEWDTSGYVLDPIMMAYTNGLITHTCDILRYPSDWLFSPSGVIPFTLSISHDQPKSVDYIEDVVSELLTRAGYSEDDCNVSELIDDEKPLRALALSQVASTRSALEVLQKCWFFECSATDKLTFRKRAVAPVVRIPFADLGFASQSGGADDPLAIKLGNDLEMPAQIALTYPNVAGDYNADTQFSDRLISGQQSTQTMQVPVGMLPAEAKAVADALLIDAVASLQSTTLSVSLRYAFVEPGDVVEAVAQDGRIYRFRVQLRKDMGQRLDLECLLDDVGALDSAAITDTGYVSVQDPTRVPDSILLALDLPLLRDADDQPGFYLAASPDSVNVQTDQWKGAGVASSWDDVDYAALLTILQAATVGKSLTVLPGWSGGPVFDEASVLRVEMLGQLASSTRAAMLLDESVNALLVGDEIVRFRDAQLVASDPGRNRFTYDLTGFIRGFRGTEWSMGGHADGERCVLLSTAVRRVNTQLNELSVERWLKATTVGKFITDVEPQAFVDTGRALKPFAPAGLRALTEGGVGVHLSWQRRTRLSYRYGGVMPSVPLGESAERYRVQVWADGDLLRTETVTQPRWTYSKAMAMDDGLGPGDQVRFEVCQLSESVGPGYITEKEGTAA